MTRGGRRDAEGGGGEGAPPLGGPRRGSQLPDIQVILRVGGVVDERRRGGTLREEGEREHRPGWAA